MTHERSEGWWRAVQRIADMVNRDEMDPDEENLIRQQLLSQGFSTDQIGRAMDWIENANTSGHLFEALTMLQPSAQCFRVDHPLETASICNEVRRILKICREQGLLSFEFNEKLIEGLRMIDTRDWDEQEAKEFMGEVLTTAYPCFSEEKIELALQGRLHRFGH